MFANSGGNPRDAMKRLDKLFADLEQKYPGSARVRDEDASYLWYVQRKQEAFMKWQEAERLDGNDASICLHLGACYQELGDTTRAAGYFEKAVALAPRDALLHFNLGNELYLFRHELATPEAPETSVVDRALSELRKASEIDPLNATYAKGYAETFYSIPVAKWAEAIKAWQHVYDISPDKDFAAINLARVSIQMRNAPEARRYLREVTGASFAALKRKLLSQADSLSRE